MARGCNVDGGEGKLFAGLDAIVGRATFLAAKHQVLGDCRGGLAVEAGYPGRNQVDFQARSGQGWGTFCGGGPGELQCVWDDLAQHADVQINHADRAALGGAVSDAENGTRQG